MLCVGFGVCVVIVVVVSPVLASLNPPPFFSLPLSLPPFPSSHRVSSFFFSLSLSVSHPPPFAFFHCTHSLISFPRQCCLEREPWATGFLALCVSLCLSVYRVPLSLFASLIPACNHPLLLFLIPLPLLHSTSPPSSSNILLDSSRYFVLTIPKLSLFFLFVSFPSSRPCSLFY